ncbi:MAG TPA: precorrin-3B synthase [Bosea sp. (in: a-proteobacteria)]
MSAPSPESLRRGWCPSTLRPMETGDGWLVRLHPPGARLTPAQLRRIAALAGEHGNGLVEISARGNMQLRGVTADSHPRLVATLLAERLVDEHDGDGPQRLTLVSPLANGAEALIDALALASEIEGLARHIAGLPAKFSIVVDDGGASSLDAFAGDMRIVGVAPGLASLALADRLWLGPVAAERIGEVAAGVLQRFAALRAQAPDRIRRLHDLQQHTLAGLCDLPPALPPAPRSAPLRAGLFALGSGSFTALIGLPFGRTDAATLDRLGAAAEAYGCGEIRLSPWRGIAFRGMGEAEAAALLRFAGSLGLIVGDDDPRLSVQACAGAPACLRAETAAMTDAARLAEAMAPLLADGLTLHVSGCVKSCARPGPSDLTLVGREGRYGVVIGGTARDSAVATLDLSGIMARLQPGQDIHARLLAAGRIAGPQV